MTHRLINQNIDIYSFPNEFAESLGSVTLGDLHGNSIKLLHFLLRHKLIRFKNDVTNRQEHYQHFVSIYEQFEDIVHEYMEDRTVLEFLTVKLDNTKDRLVKVINQLLETNDNQEKVQALNQERQSIIATLEAVIANEAATKKKMNAAKAKLLPIISQLNQFIDTLEVSDRKTLARLIGDEVADRGACDYITLRILHFFHSNNGRLTIINSNHGCEFINAYEKLLAGQPFKPKGNILDTQMTSFFGLELLLTNGVVKQDELSQIINQSYKPSLKILDYSLDEKGIVLYSHAPIRFDTIELLARQFKINYNDSTKETLAATIDQINQQFQFYIERNAFSSLINRDADIDFANMSVEDRAAWPVLYATWNRWNESKDTETARPPRVNDYDITYVHGHDPFKSKLAHVHNLDTPLGKDNRKKEAEQIKNAFEFILQNTHTSLDTSASQEYLRMVGRYKVFDAAENPLLQKTQSDDSKYLNKTMLSQSIFEKSPISSLNMALKTNAETSTITSKI